MRARNSNLSNNAVRWLFAIVMSLSTGASWAQSPTPTPTPTPDQGDAEFEMPVPPKAPKAPEAVREVGKQVRILREQDGTLRIHTQDESGERADIQVNLGEEFGGAVTRRIYEQLVEKGVLDEKGLVVEEAMNSVPRNTNIGIAADIERIRDRHHDHNRGYRAEDYEVLIAIVGILAVFGTPILIVWLVTRNSYRKKQLLMDNVNRMVAEGRDIPPELLDAMEGERPGNLKDRGFTLIAVGLGVFIWLTIATGPGVGSLGLIPLFIGVARFINWKLDNQTAG